MQKIIKDLFDNVRNVGLASLVFVAGVYFLTVKNAEQEMLVFNSIAGYMFVTAGGALWIINSLHAAHIFYPAVKKSSPAKEWYGALLVVAVYFLLTFPLFPYLAGRELRALLG